MLRRWLPYWLLYNLCLALVCAQALRLAYSGEPDGSFGGMSYHPQAGPTTIWIGISVLLIGLNLCFGAFGPGLEACLKLFRSQELKWELGLFLLGLPVAIVLAWGMLKLLLTPF